MPIEHSNNGTIIYRLHIAASELIFRELTVTEVMSKCGFNPNKPYDTYKDPASLNTIITQRVVDMRWIPADVVACPFCAADNMHTLCPYDRRTDRFVCPDHGNMNRVEAFGTAELSQEEREQILKDMLLQHSDSIERAAAALNINPKGGD